MDASGSHNLHHQLWMMCLCARLSGSVIYAHTYTNMCADQPALPNIVVISIHIQQLDDLLYELQLQFQFQRWLLYIAVFQPLASFNPHNLDSVKHLPVLNISACTSPCAIRSFNSSLLLQWFQALLCSMFSALLREHIWVI